MSLSEDIVQEVFHHLLELGKYRNIGKGKLTSYLFASVRNTAINYLARDRRFFLAETLNETFADELPEMLFDDKVIGQIREEIARLSQRTRDIIGSIIYDGKRYQEVADDYGISINTVKTLLSRGMARIRKEMDKQKIDFPEF